MNSDLLGIWTAINDDCFDGRLQTPADIDWHVLNGDDGLNAFGIYLHRSKSITIDERFRFDADKCKAGDQTELAKVEVAFRLVLHEMILQALHQRGASGQGGHGAEFVAEATPMCCPCPQRRLATLQRQKNDCCTPANLLFDNPSTIDPTSSQPGDGDIFAISGRGAERDRGQCLSDHARLVVAAGYRRRG